ncbi:MAG TPA: hypothetical protein VLM11_09835, partial [Streptosporangiaceae bacterium]|nr:hypothetical protein [Streptosporangiaceae bacterium]
TGQIRSWFAAAGFQELAFDTPATATMTGVGVHRRQLSALTEGHETASPIDVAQSSPSARLFTFRARPPVT